MHTGNQNKRRNRLVARLGVLLFASLAMLVLAASSVRAQSEQPTSLQPQALIVPIRQNPELDGTLTVQSRDQLVSIFARNVDLRIVLGHLAEESHVNIVIAENVEATVTTTLNNVPLWDALDAILRINGLVWSQKGEIIFVTRPSATETQSGSAPGTQLDVFDLNYTSSVEVLAVVKGLLSPGGKAFTCSSQYLI